MAKFVIWRVSDIEREIFPTLDKALAEATRILEDETRDSVVIVKAMRKVSRKPRFDTKITNIE